MMPSFNYCNVMRFI